ncbi:PfkB family carbohydrate kinase, partial [Rhizobiaceae sp. 2RAB30]
AGISDLSAVFLDRTSPSYTALLDQDGELIAGLADMELYELAFPKQVRRAKLRDAVAAADAVLCDTNLPAVALKTLFSVAAGRPIFAIAISPAKAIRLADDLAGLACLFMNGNEARALSGLDTNASSDDMIDVMRYRGLASGVITSGGNEVLGVDEGSAFRIKPPAARRVADVTGAGDALAGATIAAFLHGVPLRDALRHGIAAAMLTVETKATVAKLSSAAFADALALVPAAEG